MRLFTKLAGFSDPAPSAGLRRLFDNQVKEISERQIGQVLGFIQTLFSEQDLARAAPVKICRSKERFCYYDPVRQTIFLAKGYFSSDALLHEFTHHLAKQGLPIFKEKNDVFLARTVQLCFLYFQQQPLPEILFDEGEQGAKRRFGEIFAAKPFSLTDTSSFLSKIDELLGEPKDDYSMSDNYPISAFVFGFLRTRIATEGMSWPEAFSLLRELAYHPFPALYPPEL